MLTRPSAMARWAGGSALLALAAGALAAAAPARAAAPEPVSCPIEQLVCSVQVDTAARPAASRPARRTQATGESTCQVPPGRRGAGTAVPCTVPEFGRWNNDEGCYYRPLRPQPPRSEPVWEGHTDGAVYEMTCPGIPGTGGGWVWRGTPPASAGPSVAPVVLAQRAVRLLALRGPAIRTAPPAGSMGLVHVPVWMWTAVTPTTWGPASATASVPGLSVTAVARATTVTWDLGDGHSVTCHGPGTPYRPQSRATTSPTCGHEYQRSSAGMPDDAYPVTAVSTWRVTWSGGGQAGVLTVTRTSRAQLRIGEMQALA